MFTTEGKSIRAQRLMNELAARLSLRERLNGRASIAVAATAVLLWQAAFVAPQPVAADAPVDCGGGFVCSGSGLPLPPTGPLQVSGIEDQLVQQGDDPNDNSYVGPASAWGFLEAEAMAYVSTVHHVPRDSRITDWARDEMRAYIVGRLIAIAQKPENQRTAAEQTAFHTLQVLVKQSQIRAAQNSVNEYNRWHNSPCTYGWPAPLTSAAPYHDRDGVYAPCTNPEVGQVTSPAPPTAEEFEAIGSSMEWKDLIQTPPAAYNGMIEGSVFLSGLTAAALTATIAGTIVATTPAVSALFVTSGALVIFPFAAVPGSAGAAIGITGAQLASLGLGSFTAALGIASAVFIAVFGAIMIGIALWQVITDSEIPTKLQATLDDANAKTPDLNAMSRTTEGLSLISSIFLRATMPDYEGTRTGSPAAHDAADPQFDVSLCLDNQACPGATRQDTISPKEPDNNAHTVFVSDGWMSDNGKFALRFTYTDWSGVTRVAGIAGDKLIITNPNNANDSQLTDQIEFIGPGSAGANKYRAKLIANHVPNVHPTVTGVFQEGRPCPSTPAPRIRTATRSMSAG